MYGEDPHPPRNYATFTSNPFTYPNLIPVNKMDNLRIQAEYSCRLDSAREKAGYITLHFIRTMYLVRKKGSFFGGGLYAPTKTEPKTQ